ncbi:hypothetical protein ABBQ38_001768 [Trebouxia sp. C0009 RCD-2024]
MCDLGETPSLGLDMQDGWDSSIQMLWQLEQQEPLHPHLLPNDASATLENRQAEFLPTASEVENIGTQRRLHNRKVAQKRFRQREKERKSIVETELEHTQRELHQSKTYQATLEAELDMLKGLGHTSHKSHQLLSQQHEPAGQVTLLHADLRSDLGEL